MHFWIDKRNQSCSISGRYRAPASSRHRGLSCRSGAGGAAGGCCKVGGLVMVTPVHRFQPIESAAQGGCGVRRAAHCHRPARHPLHLSTHSSTAAARAHDASAEGGHPEEAGRGGGGMSLLPQSSSSPGLPPPQQVLLRLPAPRRDVMAVGRVKCGLWASLALVSSFIAAVKFYVDNKQSGIGVMYMVVCALLLVLLLAGYVLSICSASAHRGACFRPAQPHTLGTPGPRSALIEVPEEDSSGLSSERLVHPSEPWSPQPQQQSPRPSPQPPLAQLHQLGPPAAGGEPPPYHIAIWLPQPEVAVHIVEPEPQEAPPPSYDKATG